MHLFQGILISLIATVVLTMVWVVIAGSMQLMKKVAMFLHIIRKPEAEPAREAA